MVPILHPRTPDLPGTYDAPGILVNKNNVRCCPIYICDRACDRVCMLPRKEAYPRILCGLNQPPFQLNLRWLLHQLRFIIFKNFNKFYIEHNFSFRLLIMAGLKLFICITVIIYEFYNTTATLP